jgi:hypothetical protein
MADTTPEQAAGDRPIDGNDVEGHALRWQVMDDPGTRRRTLRQGWNPDDPQPGRPSPRSMERRKPQG